MGRFLLLCALGATGLVGCNFDFASLGSGGSPEAGSTSDGTSATSGSTTSSGHGGAPATTSSSVSTTTVAESASSSTGGGDIPPCGGVVDDFTNFPVPNWAPNNMLNAAGVAVSAGASSAMFTTTGNFDDCYLSMTMTVQPISGGTYLRVQDAQPPNAVGIGYRLEHLSIVYAETELPSQPIPAAVGMVFKNANVYFLYHDGSSWHSFSSIPRPKWMGQGNDDQIVFGADTDGVKPASFDDFNVMAISTTDLN